MQASYVQIRELVQSNQAALIASDCAITFPANMCNWATGGAQMGCHLGPSWLWPRFLNGSQVGCPFGLAHLGPNWGPLKCLYWHTYSNHIMRTPYCRIQFLGEKYDEAFVMLSLDISLLWNMYYTEYTTFR